MPRLKDRLFKLGNGLHRGLFRLSNGRILGRAGGMEVVELTTTGRRSGASRTSMLTSPVVEDGTVVLVASFGGDDRNPAWFLNLVANPRVHIRMRGREGDMVARVADAEEKSALWPRIIATYSGYAGYQDKTEREIPVVILEPQ